MRKRFGLLLPFASIPIPKFNLVSNHALKTELRRHDSHHCGGRDRCASKDGRDVGIIAAVRQN